MRPALFVAPSRMFDKILEASEVTKLAVAVFGCESPTGFVSIPDK
jgi:hypothetical protein